MPQFCFSSYPPRNAANVSALAVMALLAACAGSPPSRFAGTVKPVAGTCDPPSRAILTSTGTKVQFVPQDGVVILSGTIALTGQISAALTARGTDRTPAQLLFTGQLQGTRITGTYTTPRCRYAVELTAPSG